jgi:hypothetical protein
LSAKVRGMSDRGSGNKNHCRNVTVSPAIKIAPLAPSSISSSEIRILDSPAIRSMRSLDARRVVIRAVVRHDNMQSRQPRERHHQGRLNGLVVQYVPSLPSSHQHSEKRMNYRLKIRGFRGPNPQVVYPFHSSLIAPSGTERRYQKAVRWKLGIRRYLQVSNGPQLLGRSTSSINRRVSRSYLFSAFAKASHVLTLRSRRLF